MQRRRPWESRLEHSSSHVKLPEQTLTVTTNKDSWSALSPQEATAAQSLAGGYYATCSGEAERTRATYWIDHDPCR